MVKKVLLVVMGSLLGFTAQAADQGQGRINFHGTVINAPCGIAPESVSQTIEFGSVSSASLTAGQTSVRKDVDIKLVNCDLSAMDAAKTVTAAFTGTHGTDPKQLGTAGDTGTVIHLSAQDGTMVSFDGTTGNNSLQLANGDNTLHYSAWVAKGTNDVKEGEFSAAANFNLTYK
ncbi:fimbrial protein [Escherichia coli]|uniref:fimbrial protein n=1 Tax=Escherichia coli TaxID=562 RepID=UPI00158CBF93|nr:fimbrial protein [Escherichia coli]